MNRTIYIVGNPNSGKTTLFNLLTGLKQKTGNYSGVTVEKRIHTTVYGNEELNIIDLPGTYSLRARSEDEKVAINEIKNLSATDQVVFVADASSLKLHLFLFKQIQALGVQPVLVMNHMDASTEVYYDKALLEKELGTTVIDFKFTDLDFKTKLLNHLGKGSKKRNVVPHIKRKTLQVYQEIDLALKNSTYKIEKKSTFNIFEKLSYLTTHKFWGLLIFGFILLFVFQLIFSWSAYPMDAIEQSFGWINEKLRPVLPNHWISDFLTDGLLNGLAGVLVFIPQITMLFLIIGFLEQTGYMPRVSFLLDSIMKKFGLSGKSVIPLVSGYACAVPAIMATRTITNPVERLISVLVLPFVTCSARLPVYVLVATVAIPAKQVFGFLDLRAVVLFSMYLLGLVASLLSSLIITSFVSKNRTQNLFVMQIPSFKVPSFKALLVEVYDKVKVFVVDAGKIILVVSLILWFLGSSGSNASIFKGENVNIEQSYLGSLGKTIEPVIQPLGYNWKVGIALITSFAAREVFVGTLATIYGMDDSENMQEGLISSMKSDYDYTLKKPVYNFSTGISLLLFYAFAMQCMSTIAIVKRETHSWKWPLIQFVAMSLIAYFSAMAVYQILA